MKKIILLGIFAMLAGCAGSVQSVKGMGFSHQRAGLYGCRGGKIHFILVTDGSAKEYRCGGGLTGLYWDGWIQPRDERARKVFFKCGRSNMIIAKKKYRLSDGREFMITAKDGIVKVEQIKISTDQMVTMLVQGDCRFEINPAN
ncbi:hypothetical protein LLG95_15720 [bacterium]|nr:hypothetical protein [bacterium]